MSVAWVGAAVAAVGAASNADSSRKAAHAQSDAAALANQTQADALKAQTDQNAPFRENGLAGQNRLMDLLGLSKNTTADGYGSMAKNFAPSDMTTDPGYQFRLDQGNKALNNSLALRGGLLSGNAVRSAVDYNQGAASQEYQNAFNRFQTNRSNVLNPLQSLGGMAQSATNQVGQATQNYANNVGNNQIGAGNANASGYVGQGNAVAGALSQGINMYQQNQLMNQMSQNNGYSQGYQANANTAPATGSANFVGPTY